MPFTISELPLLAGRIGICPMPGRGGFYAADLATITRWSPDLVITMTPMDELRAKGGGDLPADLALLDVEWRHLPIDDFGTPPPDTARAWPDTSARARAILAEGGRVLALTLPDTFRLRLNFTSGFILDILNGTETAMTQEHIFKAAELSMLAQQVADQANG